MLAPTATVARRAIAASKTDLIERTRVLWTGSHYHLISDILIAVFVSGSTKPKRDWCHFSCQNSLIPELSDELSRSRTKTTTIFIPGKDLYISLLEINSMDLPFIVDGNDQSIECMIRFYGFYRML